MSRTDELLVARVVATGDRRAFGELVTRHQKLVRGMLARLTGRPADADDLAQETFVQAWQRLDTYRGPGRFKSWLCQIAYSRFLMSLRRDKARNRMLGAVRDEGMQIEQAHWQPGAGLDLDRALAALGEGERTCVVLCYASGLSHSEAAEVTGLAIGTVKSHVNRGRAKLKDWFDRQENAA
ncbi:MAG: RNA polymerase ECF subfamily sigma 70 factor [Oceanicaulis sp. HLUCCA04]|nr:MAG: RNA polymerase ECF subfamily sigma 70 factor [Oceanicaulis sp. HLUCCA04]